MRRRLAHAIVTANPGRDALRPFLLALLVLYAMPLTAQACAMYVPEDIELVAQVDGGDLQDLFAMIDGDVPATEDRRQELAAILDAGLLAGPGAALRQVSEATGATPFVRQAVIAAEPAAPGPQS